MELYHGDIVYSESSEKLNVFEDSYLAVEDGKVEGIYKEIPEKFSNVPVTDHGRGLIIPAFSDLHVHASQYIHRRSPISLIRSMRSRSMRLMWMT